VNRGMAPTRVFRVGAMFVGLAIFAIVLIPVMILMAAKGKKMW
jgi:hypothetical protein